MKVYDAKIAELEAKIKKLKEETQRLKLQQQDYYNEPVIGTTIDGKPLAPTPRVRR